MDQDFLWVDLPACSNVAISQPEAMSPEDDMFRMCRRESVIKEENFLSPRTLPIHVVDERGDSGLAFRH
jgi:hypothetical protein